MTRATLVLLLGTALFLLAGPAAAFHAVTGFTRSANEGGGSGMFFTGSQRARGYDCALCHMGAPGQIGVAIASDPPELFDALVYKPWETYTLTVSLVGEHRGLGAELNENSFVAELVDDGASPVGEYAESELGNLQRVEGEVAVDGVVVGVAKKTEWTFEYTAPGPGTGRISLHLAAVDGDGASSVPAGAATDPHGDDVVLAGWRFCEQWAPCDPSFPPSEDDPESPAGLGCSFDRGGARGTPSVWWLAALAIVWRRRMALAALVSSLAACFDPTLPAECNNRVCGEPSAPASPAMVNEGGSAGAPSALGTGGTAGDGGSAGAMQSSSSSTSSASSGGFEPQPCVCDGCHTQEQCEAGCDTPDSLYVCFFPDQGCWFVAEPCPN